MSTSLLRSDEELDAGFSSRIESAVATVRAWERADRSLKEACRQSLPESLWLLRQAPTLIMTKDELQDIGDQITALYAAHSSLLLLHRLTKWFQSSMTWVNQPPCCNCGSKDHMQPSTPPVRGPETPEEIQGGASRVEVYQCTQCPPSSSSSSSTLTTTTFPRFNSVATLFQTRRGRCGEYANLFGFTCRCVGFEVRYIMDVTDHVWIECWIPELQQWCMADGCEGLIQRNAMYEAGWGKSLSHVVAVAIDHVVDVTPRYTRKWQEEEFQARRRSITSSEAAGQAVIQRWNVTLQPSSQTKKHHHPTSTTTELSLRLQLERQELMQYQHTKEWTEEERNGQGGRISGSWAWKVARHEAGDDGQISKSKKESEIELKRPAKKGYRSFQLESFYPPVMTKKTTPNDNKSSHIVTITIPTTASTTNNILTHGLINVSGTNCAVPNVMDTTTTNNNKNSFISVVVVDEQEHLGCILQSRAFGSWDDVAQFVHQLPSHRIVAMVGALFQPSPPQNDKEATNENESHNNIVAVLPSLDATNMLQARLGGFQSELTTPGILYIGQVDVLPSWTVCQSWPANTEHGINDDSSTTKNKLVQVVLTIPYNQPSNENIPLLRMERHTQPKSVAMRLPDTFMPLATQVQATAHDKHQAFISFLRHQQEEQMMKHCFVGYTTKPQTPIYLLNGSAYPFWKDQRPSNKSSNGADGWNTFYVLPPPLVPDQQDFFPEAAASTAVASPQFEIPMDTNFFLNLLGPTLLASNNSRHQQHQGPPQQLPTLEALSNCRLVGLYFSAHWCGPCRSFTPMLAELFVHLQEASTSANHHGLQIVFVSSDRDESSFQHYFGTMPWLALPFEPWRKQEISQRYGVAGIPSLVILDAVSGQIVVNSNQSRAEVVQACQGGEERIEHMWKNWLTRVPAETSEILDMLELSCIEDTQPPEAESNDYSKDEKEHPYLFRKIESMPASGSADKVDPTERIKQLFAEFVQGGLNANAAAAKAIKQVAEEQKNENNQNVRPKKYDAGPLDQCGQRLDVTALTRAELLQQAMTNIIEWNEYGKDAAQTVLATVAKYVENVRKEPWAPKYRSFKLSNKVADRICIVSGGLDLIRMLGLEVFGTSQDFIVSIPLSTDLETLHADLRTLLNGP